MIDFAGQNMCNSKHSWRSKNRGWALMFQGERSPARSRWCWEFDKWSNWSWGSPLSSLLPPVPRCKLGKAAEQLRNPTTSARFLTMQPMFLVFKPRLSFPFAFLPQKTPRPAVRLCNPDAVTMLLSSHHQRHHLFFKGKERETKKLVLLMNSKQFSHSVEHRDEYTASRDVRGTSSTWGLVSLYLGGSRAPQPGSLAPGIFISILSTWFSARPGPARFPFRYEIIVVVEGDKIQTVKRRLQLIKANNLHQVARHNKSLQSRLSLQSLQLTLQSGSRGFSIGPGSRRSESGRLRQ